jgi:hypothetical protein
MSPRFTDNDPASGPNVVVELICDFLEGHSALAETTHLQNVGFFEAASADTLAYRLSTVGFLVCAVLFWGSPSKVRWVAAAFVSAGVCRFVKIRWRFSMQLFADKSVNSLGLSSDPYRSVTDSFRERP